MLKNLPPDEALRLLLEVVPRLSPLQVTLGELPGLTLAEDIASPLDLPPFDNSAMDGYALRAADIAAATEVNPVTLPLDGVAAAGMAAGDDLPPGTTRRILTGAAVPRGADTVVMQEDTRPAGNDGVVFAGPATPGANIRRAGSDISRGEVVLRAGSRLRPAEVAMLAAMGLPAAEVARPPRVGLLITGEELVEPGGTLLAGQIYNSNQWGLTGQVLETGGRVQQVRQCGDEIAEVAETLEEMSSHCDLIVTSGGVSVGDFDVVRDTLWEKARVHFWKLAVKPGKPVMLATWQRGPRPVPVPVLALPGNPVSAMVMAEVLLRPALLMMQGRRELRRPEVSVAVQENHRSPAGKVEYVRAQARPLGEGWQAAISGPQGSGRLSTLTRANALLVLDTETTALQPGDTARAMMTDWPEIN